MQFDVNTTFCKVFTTDRFCEVDYVKVCVVDVN